MRGVRDGIKRWEKPLYFVTAALAIFLAVANLLKAAKVPSGEAWEPWRVLFIALVVCAVYVPLYALYKAFDAAYEREDKAAAEAARSRTDFDVEVVTLCRQVVTILADEIDELVAGEVSVDVLECGEHDQFERHWTFHLPRSIRSNAVDVRRGRGVAGWAWLQNVNVVVDFDELRDAAAQDPETFDQRPAEERYGLTAIEVATMERISVVIAMPLRPAAGDPIGVLVLSYSAGGLHDNIKEIATASRMSQLVGGIEEHLRKAPPAA